MPQNETAKPDRVLIVDDHSAVREALTLRISRYVDLLVCGEASELAEALQLISETKARCGCHRHRAEDRQRTRSHQAHQSPRRDSADAGLVHVPGVAVCRASSAIRSLRLHHQRPGDRKNRGRHPASSGRQDLPERSHDRKIAHPHSGG